MDIIKIARPRRAWQKCPHAITTTSCGSSTLASKSNSTSTPLWTNGMACPSVCHALALCPNDIAAFVLQHATFSHRPLVSPKFLHVALGVGGWPLGYEERRCWANSPVQLVSKISNLCDHNPPTSQTDRQTDGRTDGQTTCNRNTALLYSASRGKNEWR